MPPLLPTQGEEEISGACSQSAAWKFLDRASGTAKRGKKHHWRKWHVISPRQYFCRDDWQHTPAARHSPCTQSRWTPAPPWPQSSDRGLWLFFAPPVFWHFAAGTESSDAHVSFYNNLKDDSRNQGRKTISKRGTLYTFECGPDVIFVTVKCCIILDYDCSPIKVSSLMFEL